MAYITVPFEDLVFWDKNPRIASTNAKQEEIKSAIANLDPKKLLALCKAIIEYKGLIEPPLIDSNNIVYDGNRRLTALALLNDPSFAPHSIKKAIEKLVSENQNLINKISLAIECRQETNLDLINSIVDERHATDDNGLKQITWGPLEKLRRKDPNAFILQLIEFASNNGFALPEDGFSTLERIIKSKEISKQIQPLWKDKEKHSKSLLKVLEAIYINIKNGTFDTRKLGKTQQLNDAVFPIINRVCAEAENATNEGCSSQQIDSAGIKAAVAAEISPAKPIGATVSVVSPSKPTKAGARKSEERKYLILKSSCLPDISNLPKINNIVHELRQLKVQEFPIAGAMLFRTLLELSADHFLDFHNQSNNALKLKQKLQKVISIIQQNNNYPEDGKTLDTLKNDIQNGNEDVSITKLNTFVHNDLLPNPKTLILQYINMEKLIAFMLSDVK